MLDQDFCTFLEYKISKTLELRNDEQLRGFWCDGVLLPDNLKEYSEKSVNDKRQIIMTAYMGKSGQEKYELTLRFGKKALSKYVRDLDIKECIPDIKDEGWFNIDVFNKQVTIQTF